MSDIFISYASEDRSRVEPLAKALENQGWSVWWDRTIPPGKTFDQVIEEAINAARCVVVLWSKISIKSDWVKEEANIGKERNILVPAKIDPVDLPLGFGRIQAADLTNWEAETSHPGFLSLRNAISEVAGPPPERDKSVQDAKLPESSLEQLLKVQAEEKEILQPTLRQPEPDKVKPSEPKPDTTAITESKSFEPRKTSNALKLSLVAGIIVLLIVGIWWWFSQQKVKEVRQEMKKLNTQVLNLENTIAELDKLEQIEELNRQKDTLSHQVGALSKQATKVGFRPQLEDIENRLEQLKIQLATKEQQLIAARKGRIFVASAPDNAIVKILNIDERFQQGMKLEPGEYHIEVSLRNYEPQDRWVELGPGEEKQINFELKKITPKIAWLHVETVPEDATVIILNIKPKFSQGMELEPGSYHVEVAAEGYKTERHWIELRSGDKKVNEFALEKTPKKGYAITASSGPNGSISPSGSVAVTHGDSRTFTITPNPGYRIADVKVDGRSEGATSSYTLNDVTSDRTISASFEMIPPYERLPFNPRVKDIVITDEKKLNSVKHITIEAWFKANTLRPTQWIVFKPPDRINRQPYYQYALGFRREEGGIYFPLAVNKALYSIDGAFKEDLKINEWHHVAATYDGNWMKLYLDGKMWYDNTRIRGAISVYHTGLGIGRLVDPIHGKQSQIFQGELAEVRIWEVARTAEQILAAMYNSIQPDDKGLLWSSTNWLSR